MERFGFYQPTRIRFGAGVLAELGAVAAGYGSKCMLLTTPNTEAVLRPLYDRVKALLEEAHMEVLHFDEVVPNPTIQSIEKAIGLVNTQGVQVLVAVGGGSSLDTAKAVALLSGAGAVDWKTVFSSYTDPFAQYEAPSPAVLPLVAVPTTAGTGSELTQAMVISDPSCNAKECIFHDKVFPKEALIDPELTHTLPPYLTAVTGFDAFTHAFESYMRDCASPYTRLIGLHAMRGILAALPPLVKNPADAKLREEMSLAAMLSGISLANAAACLPHPLSEVVGGIAPRIAHGQCLATLYPQFLAYHHRQAPGKCAEVAALFDPALAEKPQEEAAAALPALLREFLESVGLHRSFKALGLTQEEMEQALAHPVLHFLPFAPKEDMQKILADSFDY